MTTLSDFFLVIAISFEDSKINKLLNKECIYFLGKLSFPFYLVQVMPMIWFQLEMCSLETFKKIYFISTLGMSLLVILLLWIFEITMKAIKNL